MNKCKTILAALLIGASPAVRAQNYSAGITALAQTNISTALTDFTKAVASSPTDPNANVYLALTRLLALPTQPAGTSFLNRLGFSAAGRNVYQWTSMPSESVHNGKHNLVVPPSLDADEFTAELRTNIVPALAASEANLAQITDTNFSLFLPESVTHFPDVTIDYGDVQMMRAVLDAATVFGYTLHSWNLDAQFGAVSNLIASQASIQTVLHDYPKVLQVANPADQSLAGAAFTNAINRYFAASQFIRTRGAGVRLFNLLTNDLAGEQNFRLFLSDLESSMSAPFGGPNATAGAIPDAGFYSVLHGFNNKTVSMSNFFNGKFNVRSLLPTITNNAFIWDSFPDTTLGGLLTGLTETNLGKAIRKLLSPQLNLPGVAYSVLASAPDNGLNGSLNGVVMGADGNLYGTVPYGGSAGNGAFFRATTSGGFTVLYSFGTSLDMNWNPVNGGNPSSLALGTDKNFYGTTSYGGTNGSGNGTIFRITPGGSLKTVYTFGDQDDESISGGNPLLLGKDGKFYGVTQYGGDNGEGVIFQFTPPPAGSGNDGTFTTIFSLPYSTPINPNAFGAGAGALVQDPNGNFYGVTQFGGDNGSGSVFKFVPGGDSGPQFHYYSFPPLFDGYGNPIMPGLNTPVLGANGLLYGTAQYGGDIFQNNSNGQGDGFLYSVDTNGDFNYLYYFDENNLDGFGPIGAMVQAANGDFYGITSSGGGDGNGTIFRFTHSGVTDFRVWFNRDLGKQQGGQFDPSYYGYPSAPSVGLVAATGGFYGTTSGGGENGQGTVFRFNNYAAADIVTSPVSTTNYVGANVELTAAATGAAPLTYKWQRVGTSLPGNATAASATLTIKGLTVADAGSYFVVAVNSYGSSTSAVAVLTVLAPPTITVAPKAPSGILQGDKLSLTVTATGPNLIYEWLYNTVLLTDNGVNISGTGTSNLVINPAYTTNSGSYQVVVSNAIGSATSGVVNVTVSKDTSAPGVTITSPAKDGTRSNVVMWTFSGAATDNVRVTNVSYWITNLSGTPSVGPIAATLTAGSGTSSTWSALVSPPAGSNVFTVQSRDFSGNPSPMVSRKFFAKSPVALTVITNGTGSGTFKGSNFISGETVVPADGALLNVGESYSITARPDAHSLFDTWSGSGIVTTTSPTLTFIMRSNTSLTAYFVTNMFLGMAGTYNGVFSDYPVAEETAGMISGLTLKTNGFFSATLHLDGAAPAISGTFSSEGRWNGLVPVGPHNNVRVELIVGSDIVPREIFGSVTGTNLGGWASELMLVASLTNSSQFASKYDMLIPPSPTSPITNPPGYGYALLTNAAATATVNMTGILADGTTISQSMPIGEDNMITIYPSPYLTGTSGMLFGRISLSNSPAFPGPTGILTWIKKSSTTGSFRAGFTNDFVEVQGSPWLNSPVTMPGWSLILTGGGQAAPLVLPVYLMGTNLVPLSTSPNYRSGSVNTNNGQMTITFTNNAKVVVTGHGALLQDFQFGGGFFASPATNPTNFGSFTLEP